MLALVRSGTWEWALLFHALGALLLLGGMLVIVVATAAAERRAPLESVVTLRRLGFRTLVLVVIPSFVLMRVSAEWVRSEDPFPDNLTWIDLGYMISDAGVVVLLALVFLGWRSLRRSERGGDARPLTGRILTAVASLYLVALFVALWAMTTKPD